MDKMLLSFRHAACPSGSRLPLSTFLPDADSGFFVPTLTFSTSTLRLSIWLILTDRVGLSSLGLFLSGRHDRFGGLCADGKVGQWGGSDFTTSTAPTNSSHLPVSLLQCGTFFHALSPSLYY